MSSATPKRRKSSPKKPDLEELFNHFPDPIFITDRQGNIVLSNTSTATTIGLPYEDLVNSNLRDLVQQYYYDKSYALEAAEKKIPVSGRLITKLNIHFISTSTPVLDEEGNVMFVITIGRPEGMTTNLDPSVSQYKREIEYLRRRVFDETDIVAVSPAMRQIVLTAHNVAQTDSTVLILGESGAGKEGIAKYIHYHSKRSKEAFIAVNCAAIPENLVEAELFGYEKGAFTGADSHGRLGLFEAADGGTVFLDEIGELPLLLQSKLLRVLETGEIRPVGSHADRKINFRLITATNRNLEQMVADGSFRQDLFYRLNVIPLSLPPLRERLQDIAPLTKRFLDDFNKKYDSTVEIRPDTIERFKSYHWPGNVRELKNAVEKIVVSQLHGYPLDLLDLYQMDQLISTEVDLVSLFNLSGTLKEARETIEKQYIDYVLASCGGSLGKAAEQLGIYRTVLYRKLKSYEKSSEEA